MTKSRIAIFEGYGRRSRPSRRYGAPLFQNPRMRGYGRGGGRGYGYDLETMPRGVGRYGYSVETMPQGVGGYGRRGYFVPPLYGPSRYGPATERGARASKLKRKGYRVKKGRNSKWQVKFKKAAKRCARVARRRGARKGSYQSCMRQALKKKRSRR